MAKLSEKALRKRDAARDIGAELLASVREMKAGRRGTCTAFESRQPALRIGITSAPFFSLSK